MIGNALRDEIDRSAARMRRENPLFTRAAEGTIDRRTISRYLTNIHVLLQHTPIHLERARKRARELGREDLARHFDHKMEEEVGHDAWAERDLRRVSNGAPVEASQPLVTMEGMLRFIESVIDRDPAEYLAYIFFAEYLIVVLGPEWLDLLEKRCGIPKTSMTAIGNHIELDKDHVDEALATIDELVGDPSKLPAMRDVVVATVARFENFCAEVTGAAESDVYLIARIAASSAA